MVIDFLLSKLTDDVWAEILADSIDPKDLAFSEKFIEWCASQKMCILYTTYMSEYRYANRINHDHLREGKAIIGNKETLISVTLPVEFTRNDVLNTATSDDKISFNSEEDAMLFKLTWC